ncbi:hypothetical protein [Deinococcus hohokamensis]|uniref:Uncharacterized protein n=1 Tax=Deinococcus hohokamensis TaxID=309883 RepID=A0ABV9I7P7_9DEIO
MNARIEVQGWEMLALHKLLLDYKFDLGVRDELFASTLLADLAERLLNGLVALDAEVKGIDSHDLWVSFLTVSNTEHPAVPKVLDRLRDHALTWWIKATLTERQAYLRAAFSPYRLADDLLVQLAANDFSSDLPRV